VQHVSRPRALAIPVAVAALALQVPATASDGAAHAARKSCGTISSTSTYDRARVVVLRRVKCRTARRVARRYDHRGTTPSPWRCGLAHDDRPRLFSCGYPAQPGDIRRWRHALVAIGVND
jgi:hypothetical protein